MQDIAISSNSHHFWASLSESSVNSLLPRGRATSCLGFCKAGPCILLLVSFIFVTAMWGSREQVALCRMGNGQRMSETNSLPDDPSVWYFKGYLEIDATTKGLPGSSDFPWWVKSPSVVYRTFIWVFLSGTLLSRNGKTCEIKTRLHVKVKGWIIASLEVNSPRIRSS